MERRGSYGAPPTLQEFSGTSLVIQQERNREKQRETKRESEINAKRETMQMRN